MLEAFPFQKLKKRIEGNRHRFLLLVLVILSFSLSMWDWGCFNLNLAPSLKYVYPKITGILGEDSHTSVPFLIAPFLYIFGPRPFSLSLSNSLFTSLSVIFSYLLGKELFNKKTGILFSFLMVVSPPIILFKYSQRIYTIFFFLLSSYLWFRFIKEPKKTTAALTGLVMGLGIYQRLHLVYLLIGLFLFSVLFKRKNLLKKTNISKILILVLFIILGASPLLIYNLKGSGTINEIKKTFSSLPTPKEKLEDIWKRFKQIPLLIMPHEKNLLFIVLSSTGEVKNDIERLKGPSVMNDSIASSFEKWPLETLIRFALLVLPILVTLISRKDQDLFLVFIIFLLTFFNTITPDLSRHMDVEHSIVVMPFVFLLISRATFLFKKKSKIVCFLFFSFLLYMVIQNGFLYIRYFSDVKDPHWVNENIPWLSKAHTKARFKLNQLHKTRYVENYISHLGSVKKWTKGFCHLKNVDWGSKPECSINRSSVPRELDLVIPYPGYLKNGSNLWRGKNCDYPSLNQSACYYPYRYIMNQSSKGNINITNRSYIKDADNDRAYVILRLKLFEIQAN